MDLWYYQRSQRRDFEFEGREFEPLRVVGGGLKINVKQCVSLEIPDRCISHMKST